MLSLILSTALGVAAGAVLGHFGRCSGGACPLTATWWRGALYGGVVGCLIGLSAGGQ